MFTLAYTDLFLLAGMGVVPAALAILPLVLYPIHVVWSVRTLRAGLSFTNVSRFQGRYRMLWCDRSRGSSSSDALSSTDAPDSQKHRRSRLSRRF